MKKNKKTIYIHSGTAKTATTSIQHFLSINHQNLIKRKIFYPLVGRTCPKKIRYVNGSILMSESNNELRNILKDFNENSQLDSILLSEESLFHYFRGSLDDANYPVPLLQKIQLLKDYQDQYNLKIIIYLRNSFDYICGTWQEHIRAGGIKTLDFFIENFQYDKLLQNIFEISNIIGKQNIIIRPFEKEQFINQDIISDFLSILKLEKANDFKYQNNFVNIGDFRGLAEIYRYINIFAINKLSWEVNNLNIKDYTDNYCKLKITDSLSRAVAESISNKFYDIECKIAKEFINKEELFIDKYPKNQNLIQKKSSNLDNFFNKREIDNFIKIRLLKNIQDSLNNFNNSKKNIQDSLNNFNNSKKNMLQKLKNSIKKRIKKLKLYIKS